MKKSQDNVIAPTTACKIINASRDVTVPLLFTSATKSTGILPAAICNAIRASTEVRVPSPLTSPTTEPPPPAATTFTVSEEVKPSLNTVTSIDPTICGVYVAEPATSVGTINCAPPSEKITLAPTIATPVLDFTTIDRGSLTTVLAGAVITKSAASAAVGARSTHRHNTANNLIRIFVMFYPLKSV